MVDVDVGITVKSDLYYKYQTDNDYLAYPNLAYYPTWTAQQ